MFKLPTPLPTSEDTIEILTDYIEYECVRYGRVSLLRSVKNLLLQNDELLIEGIIDETDEALAKIEEITQEIQRRSVCCLGKYPFLLQNSGYNIAVNRNTESYWVYLYLLLSTRLNMKSNKVHNGIDGTKLLEQLSAIVAKSYFGERSKSIVFGTAISGSFEKKVEDLCRNIGEGKKFINRSNIPVIQQDDKLDVVVWTDFQDKRWSKIIGFGQCKTGTSFDDQATIELQPDQFCKKWFLDDPIVMPVKMFFCSQHYPLNEYSKSMNGGLIFDRLRLMDFLPEQINTELHDQIVSWCNGALNSLKNPDN